MSLRSQSFADLVSTHGKQSKDSLGREAWTLNAARVGIEAYPPYGYFTYHLIPPNVEADGPALIVNAGVARPLAPRFERTGPRKDMLSNERIEDEIIAAFLKSVGDNAIDQGRGDDPPDRHLLWCDEKLGLEITSITIELDKHVEAFLERLRNEFAKGPAIPHLADIYVSVAESSAVKWRSASLMDYVSSGSLKTFTTGLRDRRFGPYVAALARSSERFNVEGSPLCLQIFRATFPYSSAFYHKLGF